MRHTRTRYLRTVLGLLREFGVTEYEEVDPTSGKTLKLRLQPPATVAAARAPREKQEMSPRASASALMKRAGVSDETAAELAMTLGMGVD